MIISKRKTTTNRIWAILPARKDLKIQDVVTDSWTGPIVSNGEVRYP